MIKKRGIGPNRMVYEGFNTKQTIGVDKVFDEFFDKEKFDTIIEIGTLPGGFALYLAAKAQKMKAKFYTFDKKRPSKVKLAKLKDRLTNTGGKFIWEDVLTGETVSKLIRAKGRVLILNDGEKVRAFRKFAPLLKQNDYIFTHDYNFEWASKDIKPIVDVYNLKMEYEEEFDDYLWVCFVKAVYSMCRFCPWKLAQRRKLNG